MVSPGSNGLFQRAMMSSGAFRQGGQQQLHVAQANFDFIAEKTGCRATLSKVVACLQSLNATILSDFLAFRPAHKGYSGELPFPNGWSNATWAPTIDGVTLTAPADVLARQGHAAKVPVILGSSHNAGTSIATKCRTCRHYLPMTMGENAYMKWTQENFPEPWATKLHGTYTLDKYKPFWAAATALTDYAFKCPTQRAARFLTRPSGPEVFEYNFIVDPVGANVRPSDYSYGYASTGTPCTAGRQGVAIGFDVMFFLMSPGYLATEYEKNTASALLAYLRNFAWSGNPNSFPPRTAKTDVPHWPVYRNHTGQKLWIGQPSQGNITVQNETRGLHCDMWLEYWSQGEPLPTDGVSTSHASTYLLI
jgi:carboxylesterase type B